MPEAPPRPCAAPGCPALVRRGRCPAHQTAQHRQENQRRGTAAERGYDSRWAKARAAYLREHPLCRHCENDPENPRVTPATVVDHIVPHRGDQRLFWDTERNWQPLCKRHHDVKTATEDGGFGR